MSASAASSDLPSKMVLRRHRCTAARHVRISSVWASSTASRSRSLAPDRLELLGTKYYHPNVNTGCPPGTASLTMLPRWLLKL